MTCEYDDCTKPAVVEVTVSVDDEEKERNVTYMCAEHEELEEA